MFSSGKSDGAALAMDCRTVAASFQPKIHILASKWWVNVCSVACEEDPVFAIGCSLFGSVGESMALCSAVIFTSVLPIMRSRTFGMCSLVISSQVEAL